MNTPTKKILKIFVLISFLLQFSQIAVATSDRPNLLIIMTDEHNFRTLGCYRDQLSKEQALMWGPEVVKTPQIDSLAKGGALFTSMYSSTPVCSPSRSSMFTGLYPQNTPIHSNNLIMDVNIPTLGTVLSKEGYSTGYCGKWHLSGDAKPGWEPLPRYGFKDNRYMFNRGHWKKLGFNSDGSPKVDATDKKDKPNYDLNNADDTSFTTDWLTDRTLDFIEKNKQNPFCYVVSYPDPHGPDKVREPYNELFSKIKFDLPRTFNKEVKPGEPKWTHPQIKKNKNMDMGQYYGMVKCIDDNIGRIIKKLKKENLFDNTIIVFSSDHGDLCGEHCRLNKGVPYEGSAKIPFIVHYPNGVQANQVIDQAANTTDWMDTFLHLMNVQNKPKVEGRNLTPLLNGEASDWKDITFVRSTGEIKGWVAAFTDRYKLILDTEGKPWMIDMKTDPDELINVIESPEYKHIIKNLAQELKDYGKRTHDKRLSDPKIIHDLNQLL